MSIIVYADGGCSPNPGPGGWGVFIRTPEFEHELCGGEDDTTNNRMELTAAARGLEHFPPGTRIEMRCDSRYVIDAMTRWLPGWKRKGWRTTTGPMANRDLIEQLDALTADRIVTWTWVRGHAGDPGNERADYLAECGRLGARQGRAQATPTTTPNTVPVAPSLSMTFDTTLSLRIITAAAAAGLAPQAFVEGHLHRNLQPVDRQQALRGSEIEGTDLDLDFGSLILAPCLSDCE
ncbi:MAG: ribonuclease HI [Methylobacterium sp.]|uniref:ribonuclease H family protein n=1 Tax=Methylobacterium sp. TaxID=409 RepID=UPI0025FC74B1|nr:ribonuclease H [Methylobacterium sp.]MBX9933682.1 ribonuclease HI [Methylobacterium sp.]